MRNWWSALGVLLLLTGCSSDTFSENESVAREELLSLAPLGSDARKAKTILEEKGFKCHWVPTQGFAGLEGKQDFLYCDFKKTIGFMMFRRWQLALVHRNFMVTNAKFGISLTGL